MNKLANEIIALTSLIVFEAFIIASLISLVLLLTIDPDRQQRLRKWAERLPWAS